MDFATGVRRSCPFTLDPKLTRPFSITAILYEYLRTCQCQILADGEKCGSPAIYLPGRRQFQFAGRRSVPKNIDARQTERQRARANFPAPSTSGLMDCPPVTSPAPPVHSALLILPCAGKRNVAPPAPEFVRPPFPCPCRATHLSPSRTNRRRAWRVFAGEVLQ